MSLLLVGITGCRLTGVLGHEMKRRNLHWGIATLCIGGGTGMATLFEREPCYEI